MKKFFCPRRLRSHKLFFGRSTQLLLPSLEVNGYPGGSRHHKGGGYMRVDDVELKLKFLFVYFHDLFFRAVCTPK